MSTQHNAANGAVKAELCQRTRSCDVMSVLLTGLYNTLLDAGDEMSTQRRLAISKLAVLMREQINAANAEAPIFKAREDDKFQSFKASVLKRPRKNSRLWKELSA